MDSYSTLLTDEKELTPLQAVYDAFFRYITDDMYLEITPEQTEKDCYSLLLSAIPLFEFPTAVISIDEINKTFSRELSLEEQNILGHEMVQIWLQRQIASVEVIRQKFTSSDFQMTSQAAHLEKLIALFQEVKKENWRLQMLYSRRRLGANGVYQSNLDKLDTDTRWRIKKKGSKYGI